MSFRMLLGTGIAILAMILGACTPGSTGNGRLPERADAPSDRKATTGPTTSPAAVQQLVPVTGAVEFAVAAGGEAKGKRDQKLEPVALFRGAMPTGVTASADGKRIFVCFPRWGDPVNYTAAELVKGTLRPFPNAEVNQFAPDKPRMFDADSHLVSVQSVVVDSKDRLWLLDTGSINFGPVIPGGAKLVGYDLASGKRVKVIPFKVGRDIDPKTYLNDVRFDLSRGPEGTAFITDSGVGGIIVVDLASGKVMHRLKMHAALRADKEFYPMVEGQKLARQPKGQPPTPIQIHSDGIALSDDGKTLYFTPLGSRNLWSVSAEALADADRDDAKVAGTLKKITVKPSANDGLYRDRQGRIYATDYEHNAIRRYDPANPGEGEMVVQDERLLWPDTLWIGDGQLLVIANQLHRQADFHNGVDRRQQPYALFRYPLPGVQSGDGR